MKKYKLLFIIPCLIFLSGCTCTSLHLHLTESPKYLPDAHIIQKSRSISISFGFER